MFNFFRRKTSVNQAQQSYQQQMEKYPECWIVKPYLIEDGSYLKPSIRSGRYNSSANEIFFR